MQLLSAFVPGLSASSMEIYRSELLEDNSKEESRDMNHCGIQQKNTFASTCEEMRNSVSVSVSFDKSEHHMVCPKPRRLSLFNDPVKPLRWQMCYQPEPYESKESIDILEIIFEKGGGYGGSEPFFSGSPPSRVSNPLTQDTRFGYGDNICKSSSEKKIGTVGGNFGNKPAVRIEGFEYARNNCSIPAQA
ncbi:hypothetical protein Lser_V15G15085 [Lactuca serriola]